MKYKMPRDFYYPKDAVVSNELDGAAVIARYEFTNHAGLHYWAAAMFGGKRNKPDAHYSYRTLEAREKSVTEYLTNISASAQRKIDYRAERKDASKKTAELVKVGSIFAASWGYDQTNVNFYEVVAISGQRAMVRPICSQVIESDRSSEKVSAMPGAYKDFDVLISKRGDGKVPDEGIAKMIGRGPSFNAKHATASLWDGLPKYETAFGAGH